MEDIEKQWKYYFYDVLNRDSNVDISNIINTEQCLVTTEMDKTSSIEELQIEKINLVKVAGINELLVERILFWR